MRRVNAAVREVLAEAIAELRDPRIGFVTVTGVETTPDLRQAQVFVSVLGSERKRENTLAGPRPRTGCSRRALPGSSASSGRPS
jgi:ribosome-binding factor A